ncbi:hypothetical protein [Pseudoduganella namucuonensis]|uniref:hypothetical protein n=1 Tax=Pseudoduganella namucuonensis TaxID=1035707 RepID=UPI0015A6C242|nr:hypothetical protein [Pseudoduganella namucuonensis]
MIFLYQLTLTPNNKVISLNDQPQEMLKLLTDDELLAISGAPDVNNDPQPV